jgi:hypothetical protein
VDTTNPNFTEQLTLLHSAAILQLSTKMDKVMAAIDDLTTAEASLSAVINDAVLRVRALEAAVAVVPPANEAAIADIASRLVHLREYLASAVYAMPTEVVPPAPVEAAPVVPEVAPIVEAAPVVEAAPIVEVAPIVEAAPIVEVAPVVPEVAPIVEALPPVVEPRVEPAVTASGATIVETAALPSIGG